MYVEDNNLKKKNKSIKSVNYLHKITEQVILQLTLLNIYYLLFFVSYQMCL